ncbi:hypothetical protein ACFL17_08155 [Pseudomonadota bacterium]
MATYIEQANRIVTTDVLAADPYHPYHNWQHVAPPETWQKWYGPHIFHQAPGYSYLLALVITYSSSPLELIKTFQLITGALSCVLMFLITRHLIGLRGATVAGIVSAIYAPIFYLEAHLLRESISLFGTLLILFALNKYVSISNNNGNLIKISSFLIGCLIGLYLMFHELGVVLLFLSMCVFLWFNYRTIVSLPRDRFCTYLYKIDSLTRQLKFAPTVLRPLRYCMTLRVTQPHNCHNDSTPTNAKYKLYITRLRS